jgi:hypothetical protein
MINPLRNFRVSRCALRRVAIGLVVQRLTVKNFDIHEHLCVWGGCVWTCGCDFPFPIMK